LVPVGLSTADHTDPDRYAPSLWRLATILQAHAEIPVETPLRKAAELRSRLSRTVLAATSVLVLASCAGILPAEAPTHPASAPATGGNAASALQALPVKGRAPQTGYSRDQFGQAWTDDVTVGGGHNGCGTRDDILRRALTGIMVKPGTNGCVVLSGQLNDPYTGRLIQFARGPRSSAVQIEHVVALGDSWQKGAQQLTVDERTNLANDPLELLAVDGPTNQAKGDADASSWLPPAKGYRCAYIARQIAVKTKYRLWVTSAEKDAMAAVLSACPDETLPVDDGAEVEVPAPLR